MSHTGEILISRKACAGCMRCVLACSFFTSTQRAFNPSRAHIKVTPDHEGRFEVRLGDDCTSCGICVNYCEFGALKQAGEADVA